MGGGSSGQGGGLVIPERTEQTAAGGELVLHFELHVLVVRTHSDTLTYSYTHTHKYTLTH